MFEKPVSAVPTRTQITPRKLTYQPGDRIQCSAEGNPEPSYQWTDLVSGTIIQGTVLVITEEMVNKSHAFKCTATNYYSGAMRENSTTVIFSVTEGDLLAILAYFINNLFSSFICVPSVLLTLLVGRQEEHPSNKNE